MSRNGRSTDLLPVVALAALALLFVSHPTKAPAHAETIPSRGANGAGVPGTAPPRPKQSVMDILKGTFQAFSDDRTMAVAAGTTFYGLLAMFPAIASFVSIYGLFGESGRIAEQLESLTSVLPGGALDIIREQIARINAKGSTALSSAFAIGLVTSIWSATAGIKAMFDALNVAYGLKERRSFIKLNAIALAFTIGFLLITALAVFLLVAVVPLLERFGGSSLAFWSVAILRWPLLFIFLSLAIALLYRFGPSPQDQHWRWLTPGSIFAAVAWGVVSAAFSFYAANFGSYNATYGSLGAAIGLMTWMWLSITVILLGAELNAQIDKSTDQKREQPV